MTINDIKIIIKGKELDLEKHLELDVNSDAHDILDAIVGHLGEELDPHFEGQYQVNKQEY